MDKVKAIFKSDSHDSTTDSSHSHSHGSTHGTTTGTTSSSTTGSSVLPTHGSTHDSSIANAHSHHQEPASAPSHQNVIQKHANLEPNAEATHNHQHLAAVTKETHKTHEVEEVERVREHDKHIHHVQHHVQPVLDTQHTAEKHVENVHAPTHIKEQHVNTDTDKKLFAGLNQHHDEQIDAGKERTVVDKGERVIENVSHHVHHVVQPVIERDTHHHKTIHTTIPIKHTTHEAPIVHQSTSHEPVRMEDFVAKGGDLSSTLTHDKAGVLATGDCARDVDGPAEKLAEKLHLGGSHHNKTSGTNAL